ncbi:hypothetical protein [Paenisporosarcina quisquiliarum]|uniref:hypothetical protein n=1 Tax=Paenisporosarcina quisquiliarum TaxID=365346 RepID=UPI0037367DFC
MKIKLLLFLSLLSFFLLVACSDQTFENTHELDYIVATLNGKDITTREIISQFSLTDENIEYYLKQEIVIDEAKNAGATVSKAYIKELKEILYPNAESVEMEKFNVKEADALGLTNDEYFDMWSLIYLERNEYFQTYIKSKFGEPASFEDGEEWGKEIESYINNLYESYIENQKLIIY